MIHAFEAKKHESTESETSYPECDEALNNLNENGTRVITNLATWLSEISHKSHGRLPDAFTVKVAPQVSIHDYMMRLASYVNVWRGHPGGLESAGVRTAVMACFFIRKLRHSGFRITVFNLHRLILASFLVSVKMTEDYPISNQYWSKVSGVSRKDVNELEIAFCSTLNFNFFVEPEDYEKFLDRFDVVV